MNGVFDLVRFISFAVHSPFSLFSGQAPDSYKLAAGILLLVPLTLLLGAAQAWWLYKDATDGPSEPARTGVAYGAAGAADGSHARVAAPARVARSSQPVQPF